MLAAVGLALLLLPRTALAGEATQFADPTPDYPADPAPSAPSLAGDYRICPQMDHPSCSHASLNALAAKVDLSDHDGGITIVLAPGRHADAWLADARQVRILGEPGAWFGAPDGRLTRGAAISLGSRARGWAELPATTVKYIRRIEELIGVPVALLSTSPERDDTILVKDPFSA